MEPAARRRPALLAIGATVPVAVYRHQASTERRHLERAVAVFAVVVGADAEKIAITVLRCDRRPRRRPAPGFVAASRLDSRPGRVHARYSAVR